MAPLSPDNGMSFGTLACMRLLLKNAECICKFCVTHFSPNKEILFFKNPNFLNKLLNTCHESIIFTTVNGLSVETGAFQWELQADGTEQD